MKKLMLLVLALLLVAIPALSETFTAPGAFTLDCGNAWEIDVSDLEDYSDPDAGYYYLGTLFSDELVVEIAIEDYRDSFGDFSLYGASQGELKAYRQDIDDMYANMECNGMYLKTVSDNAYGIPFMIYYENCEEEGEAYYFDTMSGGWCITFYCYTYYMDDALTREHLDGLLSLLSTFRPIL